MQNRVQELIELHKQFWSGEIMSRPLVAFRLAPDFFFSNHFKASRALMIPGQKITPGMIDADMFVEDYKRVAQETHQIEQNAFWVAEPFTGFPWIEAICGCPVYATENSYITHPSLSSVEEHEKVFFDNENPWFKKYMEFTTVLVKEFKGKFTVGQPITRGMSDVVGALIGQTEMVYAIYDSPEDVKILMSKIADVFLNVINSQQEALEPFYEGYSMGFYHLWCPGKCVWFQEDLTCLMTPAQYREFIKVQHEKICSNYEYTGIHIHSSSFHILDDILDIERLKVIEINKDVGGLTIEQMVPTFKKIQSKGKKLIIWGELSKEDIDLIKTNLEMRGLHFNIIIPSVLEAKELLEYIK